MNKEKVFITGANSFIGGYLSDKLISSGFEVHGLIHDGETKNKEVITHKGDLMDFDGIGKILQDISCVDYVIHLAARTEVEKSFYDPIEFSQVNYVGTINLIEKVRSMPCFLKNFIFASTMETYGAVYSKADIIIGDKQLQPFDEETPQKPNAPYAVAKVGCEKYLEYAGRAYGLPYTILRQTNTYGRWDNDFFVVEQIITQMLKNPKEINLGYKEPYRNFLFIDDLIDLYLKVIYNYDKAKGNVFCTGPDNAITIGDLAEIIAEKLKWKGEINWDMKPKRAGEIYYLNSTSAKAKKILGWAPQIELSEGLDNTIKIWREKYGKN